MEAKSVRIVMFYPNEEEMEILNKSYEILRNVRNKFLTSEMKYMTDLADESLTLLNRIIHMDEICEPDEPVIRKEN